MPADTNNAPILQTLEIRNLGDKMEDKKNAELESLRQHVTKYFLDEINNYRNTMSQHEEYKIKIKTWCITLFVAAIGFCLTSKATKDYSKIYDFLPLILVIFFWFLNSFKDYFSEKFKKHERHDKVKQIFSDLYDYSLEDLRREYKEIINYPFDWPNKGKFKFCRGLKKTFWDIPKIMFFSYENLVFYGFMFLSWLLIFIIIT
jgi:hypothetical protein